MAAEQQVYYLQLVDEQFNDSPYKAGNIWWTFDDSNELGSSVFLCCNVGSDSVVTVNKDQLLNTNRFAKIGYDEHELLVPVSVDKRLQIFHDRERLSEGLEMKVDSSVFVTLNESRLSGTIRYVGAITVGRMFGVELDPEYRGQGTSDGTFRKTRYFKCEQDCAVFCNLYRLRLKDRRNSLRLRRSDEETPSPVESRGVYEPRWASVRDAPGHANHPLSHGERIVWMSDEGPEFGTVRWVGCLPDVAANEITVGVEFDNPIGSGTGRYKSHRLFEARRNHASLVPILGLMKMSDYMPEAGASSSSFGIRTSSSASGIPTGAAAGHSGRSGVYSAPREGELASSQEVERLNQRVRQSVTIRGRVMPPSTTSDAVDSLCGKERGLQGQSGACALESAMYALFAFSSCLDDMLYEDPCGHNDFLVTIKKTLVENIVNPLRAVNYVSSDRIQRYSELVSMISRPDVCSVGVPQTDDVGESSFGKSDDPGDAVRQVLSHMPGLRGFFTSLQGVPDCVLKIGEFDRSSMIESLQHALERIQFSPSRQQMASFPAPVLVVELSRRDDLSASSSFGMIYPDPVVDVSHIVVGFPMTCKICGTSDAELQCGDCFSEAKSDASSLDDATFCAKCFDMFHQHVNRKRHRSVKLHQGVYAPKDFNPRRARMELFAAVSRVGGHFVSFVKSGSEPDSPWLFYDGMAARAVAEGRGIFVPEVRQCHEIGKCLVDFERFSMTPFTTHSELFQNMIRGLQLCFYRPSHSETSD